MESNNEQQGLLNRAVTGTSAPDVTNGGDQTEPLLLREWSNNNTGSVTASPTPVAPAVPIVEEDRRSSSYSYPVATFVSNLVRNGIESTANAWGQEGQSTRTQTSALSQDRQDGGSGEIPLSIRSEPGAPATSLFAEQDGSHHLSARTEAMEETYILVDDMLVSQVPPPPNTLEQQALSEISQPPKTCRVQPNRVRRGVRKIGKLFKRGRNQRASSREGNLEDAYQVENDSSVNTSTITTTGAAATTAGSQGSISLPSPTKQSKHGKSPTRKKERRPKYNKKKSWRREIHEEELEGSAEIGSFGSTANTLAGLGLQPPSSSSLEVASSRSMEYAMTGLEAESATGGLSPSIPAMAPIRETLDASSSGRTASVEASFVGLLEAGVIQNMESAEAIIEDYVDYHDDYFKKDESTLVSVVPKDADFKVDKEAAPDVESMLRRAAYEAQDTDDFPAAPQKMEKRVKSDGSSVPLSEASRKDALVHNDTLKVVMVSASGVDKSYLARAIRNSTKRARKRATLGVDVHTWQAEDIKFSMWDVQGSATLNVNFGAHAGTQGLFFSSSALYILVWDLAHTNTKTYHKTQALGTNEFSSDEEDDEDDEFRREEDNRMADRTLYADIQNNVLSWVDTIANRGPHSAILPVALVPNHMAEHEVRRRTGMMQALLDQHIDRFEHTMLLSGQNSILCVDESTGFGVDQLQETMVAIATDTSQSVFSHVGTPVPMGTVLVLESIRRLREDHKLILIDHLLSDIEPELEVEIVTDALHFLASIGEIMYFGGDDAVLSRFVILSRKWLVSALSCILRNDLKRELVETRRFMNMQCIYSDQTFPESDVTQALLSSTSTCPLLSDSDARMLWQSMSFMRDAFDQYPESAADAPTMFYFLERLLVHTGVFLPVEVAQPKNGLDQPSSRVFFVPSLLEQSDPRDIWTYKTSDSWLTTLCYSWLFRDGAPPDLMEHLSVLVLKSLYEFSRDFRGDIQKSGFHRTQTMPVGRGALHEFLEEHDAQAIGRIKIHQVMCWKSSMLVKVGTIFADNERDELRESSVEIFVSIVDQNSLHGVASDAMRASMHRVILSGKGQVGHHGRKLWKGGLKVVLGCVRAALDDYANVDEQVVCPECLAHSTASSACTWGWDSVMAACERGDAVVRCMRGHRVDSSLITGVTTKEVDLKAPAIETRPPVRAARSVPELLPSVVVVGLWDPNAKAIRHVGSGYIADRRYGLIVTAGHILYDMEEGPHFGNPYFGIPEAKVVIGVIPDDGHVAVFRYFGQVVMSDVHNMDACVVQIVSKLEVDINDDGSGCAGQVEELMNSESLDAESLTALKMARQFEIEESVRVLGFNQGGEGVHELGKHVNRTADFAKGYVCKTFKPTFSDDSSHDSDSCNLLTPREEIVIMCPTISGHSGGPCVNEEGRVIGILSRADPTDRQRCYLVPASELRLIITKAKKRCAQTTKVAATMSKTI